MCPSRATKTAYSANLHQDFLIRSYLDRKIYSVPSGAIATRPVLASSGEETRPPQIPKLPAGKKGSQQAPTWNLNLCRAGEEARHEAAKAMGTAIYSGLNALHRLYKNKRNVRLILSLTKKVYEIRNRLRQIDAAMMPFARGYDRAQAIATPAGEAIGARNLPARRRKSQRGTGADPFQAGTGARK